MRNSSKKLLSVITICIGLSCGVNTGNPGTTFSGEGGIKGTSVLLDLKALTSGALTLNVKGLGLVPSGASIDSPKVASVYSKASSKIQSGKVIQLLNQTAIAAGQYDRIKLILDRAAPATFVDAEQNSNDVAVAPYNTYHPDSSTPSQDEVAIIISLASGPVTISGGRGQTLQLNADFDSALKSFSEIPAGAQEYYGSSSGQSYRFGLLPDVEATVTSDFSEGYVAEKSDDYGTDLGDVFGTQDCVFNDPLRSQFGSLCDSTSLAFDLRDQLGGSTVMKFCVYNKDDRYDARSNDCRNALIVDYAKVDSKGHFVIEFNVASGSYTVYAISQNFAMLVYSWSGYLDGTQLPIITGVTTKEGL